MIKNESCQMNRLSHKLQNIQKYLRIEYARPETLVQSVQVIKRLDCFFRLGKSYESFYRTVKPSYNDFISL